MAKKKMFFRALIVVLCAGIVVSALTYVYQGSSFAGGSFNNTLYNSSGGFVQLNWSDASNTSYVLNGTYTSSVMDYGGAVRFTGFSWSGKPGACPGNMSYIDKLGGFCIDQYEVSVPGCDVTPGANCASYTSAGYCNSSLCVPVSGVFGSVSSDTGTTVNATSRPGVVPLAGVSAQQARQMCANAGKHLCTSDEWLAAANILGTIYYLPSGDSSHGIPDNNSNITTNCNTNSFCTLNSSYTNNRVCLTGSRTNCHSREGVYDMVGNLYEWVNESITTIAPGPVSGYYYINLTSMNWSTTSTADGGKYGNDGTYFLGNTTSGRAVLRGGYWTNGASAGVFFVLLSYAPSSVDSSVGFRCCSVP